MIAPSRRVLLISSDDEPTPVVEARLADAGYEVRRCHEARTPSFPCAGLEPGGHCPLDDGLVDLALDVRDHPWPHPTGYEAGVRCALREKIPLVVAGRSRFHPFTGWAAVTIEGTGDVVAACEQALDRALEPHRAAATTAVEGVVAASGLEPRPVAVAARRGAGELHVSVTVDLPDELRTVAAARVGRALRDVDPAATRIELEITRPDEEPAGAHRDVEPTG